MSTNAFRALRSSRRRRVLLALHEANPQTVDRLSGPGPGGVDAATGESAVVRIELRHVHLPMLEDWGYVDWDRETGRVVKGPDWDEVAPLLRFLRDHADEQVA